MSRGPLSAAIKDDNNVCNAGLLASSVSKLPPTASKLILVNAGGAIRLAGPAIQIDFLNDEQRNRFSANIEQLALACEQTTIEIRTDEQLNSFTLNRKLTGLPPLSQVFGPITQIVPDHQKDQGRGQSGTVAKSGPRYRCGSD